MRAVLSKKHFGQCLYIVLLASGQFCQPSVCLMSLYFCSLSATVFVNHYLAFQHFAAVWYPFSEVSQSALLRSLMYNIFSTHGCSKEQLTQHLDFSQDCTYMYWIGRGAYISGFSFKIYDFPTYFLHCIASQVLKYSKSSSFVLINKMPLQRESFSAVLL